MEMELRHAPAEEKKQPEANLLMSKFENNDVDKSLIISDFPEEIKVHAPVALNDIAASELTQSTIEKVKFMERVDKLTADKKKYVGNLIQMMSMGFTEFDACLIALEVNGNDFEMATNSFLY